MSKPSCTNSPTSSSVCGSMNLSLEQYRGALFHRIKEDKPRKEKSEFTTANRYLSGIADRSLRYQVIFSQKHTVAVIAVRIHLFPFRTEKLSSPSPMVLPHQVGEQVAATFFYDTLSSNDDGVFCCIQYIVYSISYIVYSIQYIVYCNSARRKGIACFFCVATQFLAF